MKRPIVSVLILSLAAGLISGCSPSAEETVQEDAVQVEQEITDEESQEEIEEEVEEEQIEDVEEQDLTMTTIQSDSDIDYTSVEGIDLDPGSNIAVVIKSKKTGYWNTVKSGMEQAIKDLNTQLGYTGGDKITLTLDAPSDETDVETQINMIDTVLNENPSVICLAAIDQDSCQAQLETAAENGIPVIMLDSGVHSDMVVTTCQTDNYAAGGEAARRLSEAIGDVGKVAIMAHIPTAQTSVDREQGFRDEMQANHPQITLLTTSYENTDTSVADMAKAVIDANQDLTAYFCTNEVMALQVMEVLKNYPDRDIKVVAFDAGDEQLAAIENGMEVGVVVQNPYGMGYATIVAAARAAADMSNAASIDTGYQWIDAESIEDPVYQNYLYK